MLHGTANRGNRPRALDRVRLDNYVTAKSMILTFLTAVAGAILSGKNEGVEADMELTAMANRMALRSRPCWKS